MKSLEKKSSFSLVSSGDAILHYLFLVTSSLVFRPLLLGMSGQPPPSFLHKPESLESIIRPSWRGVKNIMQEGAPCEKRSPVEAFLPLLSPH